MKTHRIYTILCILCLYLSILQACMPNNMAYDEDTEQAIYKFEEEKESIKIKRRQKVIKWVTVGCIATLLLLTPPLAVGVYWWLSGGGPTTDVCQGIAAGEEPWAQPCHAPANSSVCCLDLSRLRCLDKATGPDFMDGLCSSIQDTAAWLDKMPNCTKEPDLAPIGYEMVRSISSKNKNVLWFGAKAEKLSDLCDLEDEVYKNFFDYLLTMPEAYAYSPPVNIAPCHWYQPECQQEGYRVSGMLILAKKCHMPILRNCICAIGKNLKNRADLFDPEFDPYPSTSYCKNEYWSSLYPKDKDTNKQCGDFRPKLQLYQKEDTAKKQLLLFHLLQRACSNRENITQEAESQIKWIINDLLL